MKLSRKNKMTSHTGCVNNKSTISIHLSTALTKLLPQSSGVWLHFHCNTFFPQTSCCRFNSFQMIMVLLHDPVSSILQPLLCFYNTLVYRWATWSVLWLYNAQVLLLPKPEVNDILHLRFVICGTMHPLWFHISKSESVPENLWFYQMLPGLEWDKKKKKKIGSGIFGPRYQPWLVKTLKAMKKLYMWKVYIVISHIIFFLNDEWLICYWW